MKIHPIAIHEAAQAQVPVAVRIAQRAAESRQQRAYHAARMATYAKWSASGGDVKATFGIDLDAELGKGKEALAGKEIPWVRSGKHAPGFEPNENHKIAGFTPQGLCIDYLPKEKDHVHGGRLRDEATEEKGRLGRWWARIRAGWQMFGAWG